MTIPDETQLAHCGECQHRYGAGCGCECCAWAGEAVKAAQEGIAAWVGAEGFAADEGMARAAVQAALPVIRGAAVAAERERWRAALKDATEGLEEMLPYVPEYFRDKWDLPAFIDRALAALAEMGEEVSNDD